MIKNYKNIIAAALLIVCIPTLYAATLSSPKEVSLGEIAATQLAMYADIYWSRVKGTLDAPVMAVYKDGYILMTIYGTRDTPEGAKKTIDLYMNAIELDFLPFLKQNFDIKLVIENFRIVYRNRTTKNRNWILIWQNGEYIKP